MSSKRDLVEAHSFNRRRLVTAFVSGAPGGREVEPVRYGRTLVGGIVLALLLVAGAAVSGFLKPTVPKDWREDKLVIGKTSGARFVGYQGKLYPVINTTSARLLLSKDGAMDVVFVPDDKIAAAEQGPTIGIPGAPDIVPEPASLVQSGWGACTDSSGGVRVSVLDQPDVSAATGEALLVESADQGWVISGEHRYLLPTGKQRDAVLRAIGLAGEPARAVPGTWLDLIAPGEPFVPFRVPEQGQRVQTGVPGLDRVGTPLRVGGSPYLLGAGGRLVKLTEFAYDLYRSSGVGAQYDELEVSAADVSKLRQASSAPPYPKDWPETTVSPATRPDSPCLVLTTTVDGAPQVELARPRSEVSPDSDGALTQEVSPGHGALVRASTAGVVGVGTIFLVDSTGTRFALGDRSGSRGAQVSLGYADLQPQAVPKAWTELFNDGPALTSQAAGQAAGRATAGEATGRTP